MNPWHAYVAGFFDGEGCISITRCKIGQYSDNHRLLIDVAQRVDHIGVLYEIQREFGGTVRIRHQSRKAKPGQQWSDIGVWLLLKREDQLRFLHAIMPMLRVKRERAELALQFLDEKATSDVIRRRKGTFSSGSVRLTAEQIDAREAFRVQMRALNQMGGARAPTVEATA